MPVTYAEFSIMPKLGYTGQNRTNRSEHCRSSAAFAVAILGYFIRFIEDIVIAWTLYVLLGSGKPVAVSA